MKKILIILSVAVALTFSCVFFFFNPKIHCKLCGAWGSSYTIQESIERGTFVREYKHFTVLTDSLTYVKVNNKSFFVERKFRYGERNALKTNVLPDSSGHIYQFGFSPAQEKHLNSRHNCYCEGNFFFVPDTIRCELWSYSLYGEKINKIGDAIIY